MQDDLYKYTSKESILNSAITEWSFESYQNCETCVLPDGCCDIIVRAHMDKDFTWFISDLSQSAYSVPSSAGTQIHGVRLHPGVQIRQLELQSWLQGRNPSEMFDSDELEEFCVKSENLSSALKCLASGKHTVLSVAKELGVSLRTLERFVKSGTGESPHYWFSLARVRKAGRSLESNGSLSTVAIDAGFSDQSHMTREMKKWFQRTPAQLKVDKEVLGVLAEPGYGGY